MNIEKVLIGLEIHIELSTKSKMFCSCSTDSFGRPPNSLTCPVCLGLPGSLPVPNKKAIEWTVILGLSLNCQIPKISKFDRKNYFYPDLPKGFQISQFDMPFAINGSLKIKTEYLDDKIIKIRRVHLEEDTAKSTHTIIQQKNTTLLDFNKAGIPLVEIVTEPDICSSDEAVEFGKEIRRIVRYLGISEADLEKGQMRFEPTINLLINDGFKNYYTPLVEIKNINSFKFLKRAIDYEISRQFEEFKKTRVEKSRGNKTTRGFNEEKMITFEQRHKEEAEEYRYFPEPDIPPIVWQEEDIMRFNQIIAKVELPQTKQERFIKDYNLEYPQVRVLTEEKEIADYFEQAVKLGEHYEITPKEIANIIVNKRLNYLSLTPVQFIYELKKEKEKEYLSQNELATLVDEVIRENTKAVDDYKKGKTQALGFLIGQLQKKSGGRINPKQTKDLLLEKIGK